MLEEKIETLITEIVGLRKAIEKNGVGGAASTDGAEAKAAAKPKAGAKPKAAAKPKAVEPEHDADEVAAIMRQAAKDVDKAAVQKHIKGAGCADLAELLTKPELFDAAYEFASNLIGGEEEEEEEEEEDI